MNQPSSTGPIERPPEGGPHDRLEVIVPGEDTFLEIIRVVAGRATRIAGFTFDGIEDFALVIDEAAVLLLETRPDLLRLVISGIASGCGPIRAELSVMRSTHMWPPDGLEETMRWQVIVSLCESVWLLSGEDAGIGLEQAVR